MNEFPTPKEWEDDGLEIQLSPSVLGSFQAIDDPDAPWMTPTKFAAQLLNFEPMSEPADAGNAVHEAAFDHALSIAAVAPVDGDLPESWRPRDYLTITNKDGNTWQVDPGLIEAIREKVPNFGAGIPEVPRLLTSEELGVEGVRMSMRADYLMRRVTVELKTTKQVKAMRYLRSAQRYAYLVAYNMPLIFVLAQVKVTKPRSRAKDVRGLITLDRIESHFLEPDPSDKPILQDIVHRCRDFIRRDPLLIAHVQQKSPPTLL